MMTSIISLLLAASLAMPDMAKEEKPKWGLTIPKRCWSSVLFLKDKPCIPVEFITMTGPDGPAAPQRVVSNHLSKCEVVIDYRCTEAALLTKDGRPVPNEEPDVTKLPVNRKLLEEFSK